MEDLDDYGRARRGEDPGRGGMAVGDGRVFTFAGLPGFDPGWFTSGRFEVLTGEAAGLSAMMKSDRADAAGRRVELWQSIRARIVPGDMLRLIAGCDKRPETCREKFANFMNFRGFPYLPGEDWLSAYPRADRPATGGSLSRPWSGGTG